MSMRPTRREFVASSTKLFGGSWLWLHLPAISALSACAREAAVTGEPFETFTAAEGQAMRAFASWILPSGDDLPGAEEAGAAWFADRALAGMFSGMLEPVRAGLADLDARSRGAHRAPFAELAPDQQDDILREVEDTAFFQLARMLTVFGVFSDPRHGGNRNHAGFRILGMDHAAAYQPPFGWYDAEYARNGGDVV